MHANLVHRRRRRRSGSCTACTAASASHLPVANVTGRVEVRLVEGAVKRPSLSLPVWKLFHDADVRASPFGAAANADVDERLHRERPRRTPAGCRGRSRAIGKSAPTTTVTFFGAGRGAGAPARRARRRAGRIAATESRLRARAALPGSAAPAPWRPSQSVLLQEVRSAICLICLPLPCRAVRRRRGGFTRRRRARWTPTGAGPADRRNRRKSARFQPESARTVGSPRGNRQHESTFMSYFSRSIPQRCGIRAAAGPEVGTATTALIGTDRQGRTKARRSGADVVERYRQECRLLRARRQDCAGAAVQARNRSRSMPSLRTL